MSDIAGGDADLQALADTGALDPEPAPVVDPADAVGEDGLPVEPTAEDAAQWKAYGQKMAKENQARRERYQPIERSLGALPDGDRASIMGFAEVLAAGDTAAVVDWLAQNAATVAGGDEALVARLEAAGLTRKQATTAAAVAQDAAHTPPVAPAEQAQVPLTREEAQQIAREEAQRAQVERDEYQRGKAHIDGVFSELGVDPVSPFGAMVRDATTRILSTPGNSNMPLEAAVRAGHAEVRAAATEYLRGQVAQRQAAGTGPVPQGGTVGREVGLPIHGRDAAQRRMAEVAAKLAAPDR